MNLLIVNGYDLSKYISMDGYEVERADLSSEESGRMLSGREHKDVIARIDKIYVNFVPATDTDSVYISNALESAVDLPTIYISPYQGKCQGVFHCGNRKTKARAYNGISTAWNGISVNFVEADPDQHVVLG